jgi:RNA polymerase sigma-70 factor (ECF subfamily)
MTNNTLPGSLLGSASRPASVLPWPAVLPMSSDANVVARAQTGDHEAFAELYSRHKSRVYRLCLRIVGNVALAEDLTQEAFLQLYRKIATFQGNAAFTTWLHRLTINVVLMHRRKKAIEVTSLECAKEEFPEGRYARNFGTLDRRLAGSIDRLAIQRALKTLPPGYRTVFLLHDVEGFEHSEIASSLQCSIGTSKSQLHKARRRLRGALSTESPAAGASIAN